MKELLKQLGFEHLPMLSKFVKECNTLHDTDDDRFSNEVLRYTNFITQPLTKGMFIPCDEEGNVLSEHHDFDNWSKQISTLYHFECLEYQQAQDRVLFENKYPSFELNEITLFELHKTIEQAINNGVKLKLI